MISTIISVVGTLATGFLSAVIIRLYDDNKKLRKQRREENEEKEKGAYSLTVGIARIFLKQQMQEALSRGYTTSIEYEIVEELYNAYLDCGGNGMIKHLFRDKYNNLKIIEKEI